MLETLTLDNETAVRLIEKLERFATEYGCTGRGATYVVYQNDLLHERQLDRDPALLARILNRHGRLNRVDLPFVADRIETKTNARIFGFKARGGQLATVKILMRHSGRGFYHRRFGNSLFADIRSRRMAASHMAKIGPVFAPKVLAYDRRNGQWLVEEFVTGRFAKPDELFWFASATNVPALYADVVRMRPVARRKRTQKWLEWLADIDPTFPQPPPDAIWPEAPVHSDLRGNMLRTADDRLCLIDWELAHVGPVAHDFASLYFRYPPLKKYVLAWLRQLDPKGEALAPEIQIALALMRYASDMVRTPAQYADELMKKNGIDYAEAIALREKERQGVRDFLAFLLRTA